MPRLEVFSIDPVEGAGTRSCSTAGRGGSPMLRMPRSSCSARAPTRRRRHNTKRYEIGAGTPEILRLLIGRGLFAQSV
jgi:hypothetical protein